MYTTLAIYFTSFHCSPWWFGCFGQLDLSIVSKVKPMISVKGSFVPILENIISKDEIILKSLLCPPKILRDNESEYPTFFHNEKCHLLWDLVTYCPVATRSTAMSRYLRYGCCQQSSHSILFGQRLLVSTRIHWIIESNIKREKSWSMVVHHSTYSY